MKWFLQMRTPPLRASMLKGIVCRMCRAAKAKKQYLLRSGPVHLNDHIGYVSAPPEYDSGGPQTHWFTQI